jgi:hypothetical protein
MTIPRRHKLAALAAGAVALTGAGAAIAASQGSSPSEESQAIIENAAAELGVTPTALEDALEQALLDRVDAKVAAGELTEEQASALEDRIQADGFPILGGLGGPGPGGHHAFADLGAAASFLGLAVDELRSELESGQTLAEVAAAEGKSVEGLVDAMVGSAKERLADDVADGRLAQEQADELAAELEDRIVGVVNGTMPHFRGGPPPGGDVAFDAAA